MMTKFKVLIDKRSLLILFMGVTVLHVYCGLHVCSFYNNGQTKLSYSRNEITILVKDSSQYETKEEPVTTDLPVSHIETNITDFMTGHDTDNNRSQDKERIIKSQVFTRYEIMRLIEKMRNGRYINEDFFKYILLEAKELLHSLDNVYHIGHPGKQEGGRANATVTIVGDIHGQYPLMLEIFNSNGFPSPSHVYIFNGDYTDKGKDSLQTLTTLLIFKLYCPECIHFTRGNHEARKYFKRKLQPQIMKHYKDETISKLVLEVINELPIGIILDDKTLIIHAGISGPQLTVSDINHIPKGIDTTENELLDELVWADPQDIDGIFDDPKRGRYFGPDVSKSFLDLNHLERIVRAHDNVENGYEVHHEGRVLTVWSAPTSQDEKGCYVDMDVNGTIVTHYILAHVDV